MRGAGVTAALLLAAVIRVEAQADPPAREVPLSLGGLFPLTGERCAEGIHALFGARMAIAALAGDEMSAIEVDNPECLDPSTCPTPKLPKWSSFGAASRSKDGSRPAPFRLNVTLTEKDSEASKPKALYETDQLIHQGVDAIVGPLASSVTQMVSLLGKYDKTPVISYYSPMAKLTSEEAGLTTFLRTFPSDRTVLKASIDLIGQFGWEGVTLITSNDEYGIDAAAEFNAYETNSKHGREERDQNRLKEKYVVYMDDDLKGIVNKLQSIRDNKAGWRILVLHAPEELAAKILHVAKAMNMVKKGWVWIGTEWASPDLFGHCVWPEGISETEESICTNMTGVIGRETWREDKKDINVMCPSRGRTAIGSVDYCLDGLSADGTFGYANLPESVEETKGTVYEGVVPLAGLLAVRVKEATTQTAVTLKQLFNAKSDALLAEFEDTCPELTVSNDHMHRLAFFAFDAVMAAAKGAADYYECGSIEDRNDAMCTRGTMLISRTWQGRPLDVESRDELLDDSGAFYKGRSSMFKSIAAAEVEDGATGPIGFTAQTESEFSSGDPKSSQLEIVNLQNVDGEGKFVQVGEWTGSAEVEVDPDEELPEMSPDCLAGHCGALSLRKTEGNFDIVWFGGAQQVPSDRVALGHGGTAAYFALVLVSLMVSLWGGSLLELMHFHYIPEAGLTCIIGMIVGAGLKISANISGNYEFVEMAMFDEALFALVLLPIIIFDAGFGAKKARFFGNIGPIMMTALFGTSISTMVVGLSTLYLGESGWSDVQMGFFESLTFGALISAVDPVATLAVFGALKVETNLNYRVFGESIINDAVSIVLFRVFGKYMSAPWLGAESAISAAYMFLKIGLGSVGMGMLMGMWASLILKLSHIHDPLLAAGCFIISSYVAYEINEAMHLSGIIASLFAGFCMRHYALVNIAEKYQGMVLDMVHMLAQMSDLVIFFMVGENVILYTVRDGVKGGMIAWTIFLCLVGRVCNIFPLCGIYNATKKVKTSEITVSKYEPSDDEKMILLQIDERDLISYVGLSEGLGDPKGVVLNGSKVDAIDGDSLTPETISKCVGWRVTQIGEDQPPVDFEGKRSDPEKTAEWKELSTRFEESETCTVAIDFDPRVSIQNQIVMFHSGLRGAIAFALALTFPSQHRDDVIDTCNCVILFTVFVMGGTTVPLLVGLNIPLGCAEDPEMLKLVDAKVLMKKAKEGEIKKDLKYRFLVLEDRLKSCITRSPKDEMGLFALVWQELTEEQQTAAESLGYSNDTNVSAKLWPEASHAWGDWWLLNDDQKEAAMVLGLSEHKWPPPDMGRIGDADDMVMQHKDGHDVGYGQDPDEEEEEGDKTTSNPVYSDEEGEDDDAAD
jgi:NhaP-type Na+/H+ or K+/H+ antiporter